jgi:large subunit ribosomal protein L19
MRTRAIESQAPFDRFIINNSKVVDPSQARGKVLSLRNAFAEKGCSEPMSWPPMSNRKEENLRITKPYCRKLLKQIELGEIARMKKFQSFVMPRITLGDFVQVRYELSRTQQTFAVFEGYCIKIAKKGLSASFTLKNTYDGVAVEQLFPFYSPRLLDVKMLKQANPLITRGRKRKLLTDRNYRYRWQYYVRHLYSEGFRVRWRQIRQHPGVMSLEPRIKRELANIRRQYAMMREEAGLPSYVWPGPYSVHLRQSREVNAERMRRMLVYAWDAKRVDKHKNDLKRSRWGRGKLQRPSSILEDLPRAHVLAPGNLPK